MFFSSLFYRFYLILAILILLPTTLSAASPLTDFTGKITALEDYAGKGKWLIVMVWASDCHVCNEEVGEYVKFNEKHKKSDAIVVGISMDGKEKKKEAEEFIKRHKVSFKNLIGEPFVVASKYQELTGADFRGTPSFMVYGPDGKVRGAQAGAVPVSVIESFIERERAENIKNSKS